MNLRMEFLLYVTLYLLSLNPQNFARQVHLLFQFYG